MDFKYCKQCNIKKEISEFYNQEKKNSKGEIYTYYNTRCKECVKQSSSEWSKLNDSKRRKNRARYYRDNRELEIERSSQWKKDNKERRRLMIYQWQINNKDKIKKYNQYRDLHKRHDITTDEWECCKDYFDNSCAYCGISNQDAKDQQGNFLHRDHVDHNGSNDISNCVPSCKSCNSSKWTFGLEEWYNMSNPRFKKDRMELIYKWLNKDAI